MSMNNAIAATQLLQHFTPVNQCHKVITHLIAKGSISPLEANKLYGVERLTSRIHEIKRKSETINMPVTIKVEMRSDLPGKRYARYYLHNN